MHGSTPEPRDWGPLTAGVIFVAGLILLVYAMSTAVGRSGSPAPAAVAQPAAVAPAAVQPALTVVAGPKPVVEAPAKLAPPPRPRRATWAEWTRLYRPLYVSGDRAFGVSWLLVAAVHKQETAFSTAAGTYHGLNFAGCCAGPMQFNVTNGRVSTWDRYAHAFRSAPRPGSYPHAASSHPSVYDDFDSMMAAARLLADSGAGRALDGRAWQAAYDYYGHDAFGVSYADVVLARARNWARHGFSALSEPSPAAVAVAHADFGAAALSALAPPPDRAPERRALAAGHPRQADRDRRPRTTGADAGREAPRRTTPAPR
jgi:hypothetical protein